MFFTMLFMYSAFVLTSIGTEYYVKDIARIFEYYVYFWGVGDLIEELISCSVSIFDWSHFFLCATIDTTTLSNNTILYWVACWMTFNILILRLYLSPTCLRFFPFYRLWQKAHGGFIGQPRMFTLPWHLILPFFYRRPCLHCFFFFFCS